MLSAAVAVVGPGVEFQLLLGGAVTLFDVDIDDDTIQLNRVGGGTVFPTDEVLTLSSLDSSLGPIVGFTFDGSTASGFGASDVTVGLHQVTMVLGPSLWEFGDTAQITLLFASVPLPPTIALLSVAVAALAVVGSGVRAWRRR